MSMIVEAATIDVTQYTVQYELLRSQVIDPTGNPARGDKAADQPRGVGLALLLSEGMPGWLKTVGAVIRTALAPRVADSRDPHRRKVRRHPALHLCGCRACGTRSPHFWRVWFSRLDPSRTNHRGGNTVHANG